MAATHALGYDNSDGLKSGKFRSKLDLARIDESSVPARYRPSLKYFVLASKRGPDLYGSTFKAAFMRGVSYRTMQRHLDWLEQARILKLKHEANKFYQPGKGIRRTATYVLHEDADRFLKPRERYEDWSRRNKRQAPPRRRHRPQSPPPAPAPVPIRPAPEHTEPHRSNGSRAEDRVRKLRRELVEKVTELMRGHTRHVGIDGLGFELSPTDSRYVPRYSQQNALIAACVSLGISPEEGAEHLKLIGFQFADGESP